MTNDAISQDEVKLPRRRILYVDHTAKMSGGEIALLNMLGHLDRTRFDPLVVLISDGPLREKLEAVPIETFLLPISPSVLETRKDTLGPRTLLRLRDVVLSGGYVLTLARFMREHDVDLVHTNSLKADILGGFAARLAGIPLLWHIRDRIDVDYLPRPVVWLFRRLCHWLPDYVIANSQSTLETLQMKKQHRSAAVYSGVELSARLLVVHDGVPRQPLMRPIIYSGPYSAGLEQIQPQSLRPVLGLVGRISSWKGQHIFLRAAALIKKRFPLVRIQIIGSAMFNEEAYEAEIRALSVTLGLEDTVEFLGFRSDIPEIIDGLTVLVHASITAEPFGQVIVEGMVAGKPVVATDGGGAQEIVLSGETGLLVPMNDVAAMADAILYLLDNPDIALEMGRRGRLRAQEHFSIERTARKIESVYDQILQTHSDTALDRPARSG
jgi:glycosyltransferase involved in cell wall biosynthesis